MTTLLAAELRGLQRPRVCTRPEFTSEDAGVEAIELAATVGLVLDPWQETFVKVALAERADGKYAASEVAQLVARQNGKGGALEAVVLHGMFLVGDRLTLWTAHQTKTSFEAFQRMKGWIEASADLSRMVKSVNAAHGDEGITLKSGVRLRFLARSKSSGRGFSPQRIIFDEAQELSKVALDAMLPSMRAQPNKQAVYAGTVPGPDVNYPEHWTRMRNRGRAGTSSRLAWMEWSPAGSDDPARSERLDMDDRRVWQQANPALGYRVTEEALADDRESMADDSFARETLSIWPTLPEDVDSTVIDKATWTRMSDAGAALEEGRPAALAVAVSSDKGWTTIGVAGAATDGRELLMVRSGRGTDWVTGEIVRLVEKHSPAAVGLDPASKAGGLIPDLKQAGVEVSTLTSREMQQACGAFQKGAAEARFVHLGQAELDTSTRAARLREIGDAEVWDSKGADISPLVAVSIASFMFAAVGGEPYELLDSVW